MWTPNGWEISFRRQVNDWEITRVADFLNTIGQFKGTHEGEDELWWQGSDRGAFRVGKAYRWLNSHNQQNVNRPWKTIWKVNIPYKDGSHMKTMCIELVANRFLRKMVRVLVATAIREAAAGADDDALLKLMDATCRRATAPPAPPDGLCLVDVGYTDYDIRHCLIP
ncbi:hypothetical protein MTR67_030399 [Solanum verrucosum]|uniref:tRNA pseudouridine synthase n=1 Tax=Solanum verrucosum TaxID=315347 RepID=A0AAF0TYD4_SOLVR|nr:hypothetical protein MTR67_030399 [Solanum verrucosum]